MNIRPEKIYKGENVFYPISKPASQVETEDFVNPPIEPAPTVRVEETAEQKKAREKARELARRQLNAARLRAKNQKSRTS